MTIEFKRAGDVMFFECPAFKVEISASDAERVEVNPNRNITSSDEMMELLTDAFKIIDMMIEHKTKQENTFKVGPDITFDVKRSNPGKVVSEMHVKLNVDTEEAEKAIDALNNKFSGTCMRNYPGRGGF